MSTPKDNFSILMNYAASCGVSFEICFGAFEDNKVCNAGICELRDKHFRIITNDKLANASDDMKYAALAHEVGHGLIKLTQSDSEVLKLTMLRELGHPEATHNEIKADQFACMVSKKGMLKLLNSFEGYGNWIELEMRKQAAKDFVE